MVTEKLERLVIYAWGYKTGGGKDDKQLCDDIELMKEMLSNGGKPLRLNDESSRHYEHLVKYRGIIFLALTDQKVKEFEQYEK